MEEMDYQVQKEIKGTKEIREIQAFKEKEVLMVEM